MRAIRGIWARAAGAAALGATAVVATALDCPDLGPPVNVSAEMSTDAVGPVVHVTWAPPPGPNEFGELQGTEFSGYRLEFRDDTMGGSFVSVVTDQFWNQFFDGFQDHEFWVTVLAAGSCPHMRCARPGHTYTFRMFARFRHSSYTCPQGDGSTVHDSVPSAELQFTVPGPPPDDGDAPTHVVAAADSRKDRVAVTWESDAEGAQGYVIRRRRVPPGPGKGGPKDTPALPYEDLATVASTVRKFLDKSVVPDDEYEYVVATVLDQHILAASEPDRAMTRTGACPAAKFDVWEGSWDFVAAPDPGRIVFTQTSRNPAALTAFLSEFCEPAQCTEATVFADGVGPFRFAGMPTFNMHVKSNAILGYAGPGDLGKLRATISHDDVWSKDAWRTAELTWTFRGVENVRKARVRRDDSDIAGSDTTLLCLSIGAGRSPTQGCVPGEPIAFAIKVVSLGPAPLYANEFALEIEMNGGTYVSSVTGDHFEERPGTTPTIARFDMASIGPKSPTKSEQATLIVVASASEGFDEMRCKVTAIPGGSTQNSSVTFVKVDGRSLQSRYVDLPVRKGGPAAKPR